MCLSNQPFSEDSKSTQANAIELILNWNQEWLIQRIVNKCQHLKRTKSDLRGKVLHFRVRLKNRKCWISNR